MPVIADVHHRRLFDRMRTWGVTGMIPLIEHSYYGPLNSYLQYYFRPEDEWMIKPQAPLRNLALGHNVINSYGGGVGTDGRHAKKPDFLICQLSGSGRRDKVKLVIEVKKWSGVFNEAEFNDGIIQLFSYVLCLHDTIMAQHGRNYKALLIYGVGAYAFDVGSNNGVATMVPVPPVHHIPVRGVNIIPPQHVFQPETLAHMAQPPLRQARHHRDVPQPEAAPGNVNATNYSVDTPLSAWLEAIRAEIFT